jgi:pilus assembly protein CpaE
VERALGVPAEFKIPSDIAIPQSVNRGVPVVLDKPRAPAALALRALADRYGGPDPNHPSAPSEVPAEPRKRGWRR